MKKMSRTRLTASSFITTTNDNQINYPIMIKVIIGAMNINVRMRNNNNAN